MVVDRVIASVCSLTSLMMRLWRAQSHSNYSLLQLIQAFNFLTSANKQLFQYMTVMVMLYHTLIHAVQLYINHYFEIPIYFWSNSSFTILIPFHAVITVRLLEFSNDVPESVGRVQACVNLSLIHI